METATRNSLAHRLVQHILMYPIFFALLFGVYRLIDHVWEPSRSIRRTSLSAAMLAALFAALYPVKRFRRPKLGDAPRS